MGTRGGKELFEFSRAVIKHIAEDILNVKNTRICMEMISGSLKNRVFRKSIFSSYNGHSLQQNRGPGGGKNDAGWTPLHACCHSNTTATVGIKILEVGMERL